MDENKFIGALSHQHEIEATRVGGLGGSDAAIVYKVGKRGIEALNATDKKRLAVMMGKEEYKPLPMTPAMQAGHYFEDYIAENFMKHSERERFIEKDIVPEFRTFAHCDFFDNGCVTECKYINSKDTKGVIKEYYSQLQWYYMLGAKRVIIVHGVGDVLPFKVESMKAENVSEDEEHIEIMFHGLHLIAEYVKSMDYKIPHDLQVCEAPAELMHACNALNNVMVEIKSAEDNAKEQRSKLLELMEKYNIKSIAGDTFTLSYVAPTTGYIFDKDKLFNEHPEIKESDYQKEAKRKACVKFTFKK